MPQISRHTPGASVEELDTLTGAQGRVPSASRRVHDHRDADETDERPDGVRTIRAMSVDPPAPQEREHDEHPAIRGVDAAEVGAGWLKRRQDTVEEEHERAERAEPGSASLTTPEPDEVSSTDLTESRGEEQEDGADHGWSLGLMQKQKSVDEPR